MANEVPVICLDGPGGVGKGTICMLLAESLGWHILDSGSLYRIAALQLSRSFPNIKVESLNIGHAIDILENLAIEYKCVNGLLSILLAGEDVTEAIRNEQVGAYASQIAAIPEVRQALLQRQREFLQPPGLIADGRDMGTVVFPDSSLKIYLTATPEERAQRRYKQLKDKGIDVNILDLVEDLRLRDERDMNRTVAPLKPASDAIIIDTTSLTIQQVAEQVMGWVKQRLSV
jgi:cytidylate kinase